MSGKPDTMVIDHLKLVLSHMQMAQTHLEDVKQRLSGLDQELASQTKLTTNLLDGQSQAHARMSDIEARLEQLERRIAGPPNGGGDGHNGAREHVTNGRALPDHSAANHAARHPPARYGDELRDVFGYDPRRS